VPRERNASAAAIDERTFDLEHSAVGVALAPIGTALAPIGTALLWVGSAVWRTACRRPWDSLGTLVASGAIAAVFVNAVFLQATRHPAPILPGKPRPVAEATGSVNAFQPRHGGRDSADPARSRIQIVSDIQRELSLRGFFDGPVDGLYGSRTDAAIRDFELAAGLKGGAQPDEALLRTIVRSKVAAAPPLPVARPAAANGPAAAKSAASAKRLVAVQRALADFGYGQVRPTGIFGPDTKAAIERFERERKLPVTGQLSDRLTRELAAVTGRPLE
jgi:peptidoglycan hydrolase-like protein with peptidoglycan-binding domain